MPDKMTKAEIAAWKNGYLIACCNLTNLHDRPELASDVLAEADISKTDVRRMKLPEYDQKALREIRKARQDDPIS